MKPQYWMSVFAALLLTPQIHAARTAYPGTINYVEGKVAINGQPLGTKQAGDAALEADQLLTTEQGKAEVLLSPGAFLRVGSNSEIRMISPGLADPKVEILRGEAMVEVDNKPKSARLAVLERGYDTTLLKEGLYKFDADEGKVSVIDGKAEIGDKQFGKGREVVLNGGPLKPEKFDRNAKDELYRWSEVRSNYLAQVNESTARTVYVNGGGGYGFGPGWAWNPYFSAWSWLPGDGFFYSPFGYPFFSPGYVIYSPRYSSGFYPRGGRFIGGSRSRAIAPRAMAAPRSMAAPRTMAPRAMPAPRSFGGGGHFGRR